MGARGPKPTPKPLLEARGSRYAKSRSGEPTPIPGAPVKPDWLGDIASETWDRVVPLLAAHGVLSPVYGDFVAQLCLAVEDIRKAEDILAANNGPFLESPKSGAKYLHPAVALKQNAMDRLIKFGREFGMSPSSVRNVAQVKNSGLKLFSSKARFFHDGETDEDDGDEFFN